ncbi:glycosyltransferase family 2 protein [Parapusillimonas granuli]|uniref:Glycosyltransferase n=1 Tax=Parapusillimonas granuli TaxID=380911 RepID=A0A853G0Z3_9BURK|nr:glycosyltransferase [Parapusillimonas granuli]MBB5213654.1 GT2 family glycosyltransferase [Parapusillimonas granuli]MEB2398746.1 glycosyltransferase [Alcaligenaceae bacterium]NYT48491.1 glycosyltransferase [Parapusillimonas granuli]
MNRDAPGRETRVSVVVLTHNRREELCRSLDRLLALPDRAPIIVVDNAGADGTAQCLAQRYPGVSLVRSERNLGAAGRNLGVERVRTPYVAFCDDDTWWAAGSLRKAADLLDARPDIAVLNARIVVGPDERPDPACEAMAASPLEHVPGIGPMLTGFMAGANVMRASAYRKAGGYWPPFFIGGEEALLAMDILDAGGRIVYAPELLVHHWPSLARDSGLRRRLIARNAVWTAWLRLPWPMALRRSAPLLFGRALFDALGGWDLVQKNRRVLRPETCALLERVRRHEASQARRRQ